MASIVIGQRVTPLGEPNKFEIEYLMYDEQLGYPQWETQCHFRIAYHYGDNALVVNGIIHRLCDGGCWAGNAVSVPTPEEAMQWLQMNKII